MFAHPFSIGLKSGECAGRNSKLNLPSRIVFQAVSFGENLPDPLLPCARALSYLAN
jgi:hypothetical protein